MHQQARQPLADRLAALRWCDKCSIRNVPPKREQGIVRALTEPRRKRLAQGQPGHSPPQRRGQPPTAPDGQLHGQDCGREPEGDAGVGEAADVSLIHEAVELVGDGGQKRAWHAQPEQSAQRVDEDACQ